MADATRLLIGGPGLLYVGGFAIVSVVGIIFVHYDRYVTVLKWMTLSLLAYIAARFAARLPWVEALSGLVVPRIVWSSEFFTTLVAIFGTTISPYLFFWQASQEAEDVHNNHERKPLRRAARQAPDAFARIRADTLTGMRLSNLIALAIMFTTAGTLNKAGVTDIATSAQAAEALRPVAGNSRFSCSPRELSQPAFSQFPSLRDRRPMRSAKHASGRSAWRENQKMRSPFILPWPQPPASASRLL
jgi:Mn2+/Fe2+ NRAMP family transporter